MPNDSTTNATITTLPDGALAKDGAAAPCGQHERQADGGVAVSANIVCGDALDVFSRVRGLASIVSDPPGGGSFMGLAFDHHKGGRDGWIRDIAPRFKVAREATERGAWGLFWSFPRTAHWTACALDDAGWEVVSCIEHVHGQGWPKGKSQLKPAKEIWWLARWGGVTPLQIDRCRVRRSAGEAGTKCSHFPGPCLGHGRSNAQSGPTIHVNTGEPAGSWPPDLVLSHCPACREAGARKVKGAHSMGKGKERGVGFMGGASGLNCKSTQIVSEDGTETVPAWECLAACACGLASLCPAGGAPSACPGCGEERWWACPVAELDGQSGITLSSGGGGDRDPRAKALTQGAFGARSLPANVGKGDSGGASRFFPTFHYDAKASRAERQAGCDHLLWVRDKAAPIGWRRVSAEEQAATNAKDRADGNVHATIKPIGCGTEDGFMRWAVRLVTPVGGRVGDPFIGSGSTAVAAQIEGHPFEGCDIDPGAVEIAKARLVFWTPERHRMALQGAKGRPKKQEAAAQADLFASPRA